MRRSLLGLTVAALLVGSTYWMGCGGDEETTIFSGNVVNVTPSSAAALPKPAEKRFALSWPDIPAKAYAQGTCGATGRLLFCIQTSTYGACTQVGPDCDFELEVGIERERDAVLLAFASDTNENGVGGDNGEPLSTIPQNFRYCNGDRVRIANAAVNFTTGQTAATVTKTVDKCTGTSSTPSGTVTPSGSTTPSGTITPGGQPTLTGTPYVAAAPLNTPPSSMLAFLFSAGAVGVLIPRRRRK